MSDDGGMYSRLRTSPQPPPIPHQNVPNSVERRVNHLRGMIGCYDSDSPNESD